MLHTIISTAGLGVLGIDPFTAAYMIAMGLRREKKGKIALFFFSFAGFSILIGAVLAAVFGTAAADIIRRLTPPDNSPLWAVLEFAGSVFILAWVFWKKFKKTEREESERKKLEGASSLKYLATGFLFAVSCFSDPTYYAVILLGGESGSFLTATFLLTVWFAVSQVMSLVVYIAILLNVTEKLAAFVDRHKGEATEKIKKVFYVLLVLVSIGLMTDTGYYLFTGNYLF